MNPDKPKLLLVDDSSAVLGFELAALSGLYQTATASNGLEALQRLEEQAPDCLVLDLSMPGMDGDEVLRRLRASAAHKDIAVLIVSSEGQRARDCLAAGADDFLLKPFEPKELRARVAAALAQAERRAASRKRAILPFRLGNLALGLDLAEVDQVLPMCACTVLKSGPAWLWGRVDLHGEAAGVADLGEILREDHHVPLVDQRLLVLRLGRNRLALCVDWVQDPEELEPGMLEPCADPGAWAGPGRERLAASLESRATLALGGEVHLIQAAKLFGPREQAELEAGLLAARPGAGHA